MEVVGLVIGVVSLLPVVIDGWSRCSDLFHDAQKFTKDIRKTEEKLQVQRLTFHRECRLLLRAVVDPAMADTMMQDPKHSHWKDKTFRHRWDKIMGDKFDVPIKIVMETLQTIETTLSKLQDTATGSIDENGVWVPSKASRRKIARVMTKRVDWVVSGKTKLQKLIGELRDQNGDLRTLREQRAVFEQSPPERRPSLVSVQSTESKAPSRQMLRMQDDSKRLLRELRSKAVCSCHQVNFRLASPSDLEELEDEEAGSSFRFMVTSGDQCIRLTIQGAAMTVSKKDTEDIKLNKVPSKTASGRGKIKFAVSDDEEEDDYHLPPPSYPGHTDTPTVDSLCSLLSSLPVTNLSPSHCLGNLQNYVLYTDPSHDTLSPVRLSLAELLSRPDQALLLPPEERLKVALTLSLSLLQFGCYSASWFQERWRSRDVFFFMGANGRLLNTTLEDRPEPVDNEEEMQPYVVPFRPTPVPENQPQGLARNEQMYSLALVMIEIALGQRLFTVAPDANTKTAETDEYKEYIKAKRILESRIVGRHMGRVFDECVKRCFFCDFGGGDTMEDDFSKRELQNMFYERVVVKLQECWKGW